MRGHRILQLNGLSTAACALMMLVARGVLYPLFGLDSPVVLDVLAIGFIAYAVALLAASQRRPVARGVLLFFTVADVAYVAASAITLVVFWSEMAPLGRLLIVAVALVVEVLATLQFRAAGGLGRAATQMA